MNPSSKPERHSNFFLTPVALLAGVMWFLGGPSGMTQTMEVAMKLTTLPSGTNGTDVTVTFAGESVSAGGRSDDAGCGEAVDFSQVPSFCTGMIITLAGAPVDRVYENDGACSVTNGTPLLLEWQIRFPTNTATILFPELCPDGLPADGVSITPAWLDNSTLRPPISWHIDSPDLGCAIISSNDYGCIVRAGTNEGTIVLYATSQVDGCYTRASLDLFDPDDGGGCGGNCGDNPDTHHQLGDGWPDVGSVDLKFFLGKSRAGKDAGALKLVAGEPTGDLYTPQSLVYPWWRPDMAVHRGADNAIAQVKTPQGLVDVVVSNANFYTVNFYRPGQFGPKSATGFPLIGSPTPFAVWAIENPDPATTNRLRATHSPLNQASTVYEYRWLTNGWELDSASGLRVKARTSVHATNNGAVYRTETTTIRQGTNAAVSQQTRLWQQDGPDWLFLEETWGTGANARTNQYSWDWSRGPQRMYEIRWDGTWTRFTYDSSNRLSTNFTGFLDQTLTDNPALCRGVVYDYSTNLVSGSGDAGTVHPYGARCQTESITNQPVSKRYHVYLPGEHREIQCVSPTAAWNDSGNLVTVTKTYTAGRFYGRPRSVKRPDGTMDLYSYATADYTTGEYASPQNVTNVVMTGVPDAYETNIVEGVRSTTVVGPLGGDAQPGDGRSAVRDRAGVGGLQ